MKLFDLLRTPISKTARAGYMAPSWGSSQQIPDPDSMGRVKVKFPWMSDDDESHWAGITSFALAGKDRGAYFLPEVEDEVLVMLLNRAMSIFPTSLGGLVERKGYSAEPADGDGKKARSIHENMIREADTYLVER